MAVPGITLAVESGQVLYAGSDAIIVVTGDIEFLGLSASDFTLGSMSAGENIGTPTGSGDTRSVVVTLPDVAGSVDLVLAADSVYDASESDVSPHQGPASAVTFSLTVIAAVTRTGRAVANPAAKNYGTNIVAIAAEQEDYFVPRTFPNATPSVAEIAAAGGYPNVIEFRPPYGLLPIKNFYPVARQKGNPSPDPSIPGMEMGGGQLNFYLDPTLADFWIKHLLQATTVSSRDFGDHSITTPGITSLAGGTSTTFGTASPLATGKQPKDIIGAIAEADDQPKPPRNMTAGRLKFTFASTDEDLLVNGEDHNGAPIEELLESSAARTEQTTRQYFADKVTLRKKGTGTLAVSGVDVILSSVYEHVLKFVSEVSEGLSLEVHEGNKDTPITYDGMLISRGIFRLEDIARMQMMVIANAAHPRQAMSLDSGGVARTEGTNLDNFNRLDFNAVPNLGMSWELPSEDNPNVPEDYKGIWRAAQLAFACDNRIAPPATSFAEDFHYPKPVRKTNREIQMQVAIDHSREADFDRFVGGLKFKSVISATSRPYGDTYRAVRLIVNQSQFVANPTRQVGALEEILQMLVIRANIGTDPLGNDEAEFIVINTNATF